VALVRLQTSRFDEALDSLGKAEALKPTPRTAFNTARALMNLGRFKEAETRLAALLAGKIEEDGIADGSQALYAETLLLEGKGGALLAYLKSTGHQVAGELQVFTCRLISRNDWKSAWRR
jgi:predicted Zn-dependent protease